MDFGHCWAVSGGLMVAHSMEAKAALTGEKAASTAEKEPRHCLHQLLPQPLPVPTNHFHGFLFFLLIVPTPLLFPSPPVGGGEKGEAGKKHVTFNGLSQKIIPPSQGFASQRYRWNSVGGGQPEASRIGDYVFSVHHASSAHPGLPLLWDSFPGNLFASPQRILPCACDSL